MTIVPTFEEQDIRSKLQRENARLNKAVEYQREELVKAFNRIESLEDQLAAEKAKNGSLQTEIKAYEYERNNVRLDHRSLPMRTTGSVSAMRRHRSANYSCEIK